MSPRPLADLLPAAGHVLGMPGLAARGAWLSEALVATGQRVDGQGRHARAAVARPRVVVVLLVDGLGALRTHAGSAHGRGRTAYKVAPRHSRLALNAAHTLVHFLLETWADRRSKAAG